MALGNRESMAGWSRFAKTNHGRIVFENDYDYSENNKNRSNAISQKDEMYIQKGAYDEVFHEFAHLCGLSDRYNIIQLTSDNIIFADYPTEQSVPISGQGDLPAWWTVNMQLSKEYDSEYFNSNFENPMSSGAGKLTLMQMNLIMDGKREETLDQYSFYFRASGFTAEVSKIKSIGISENKLINANKTIVYGRTDGTALLNPFIGYVNPRTNFGSFDFHASRKHDGGTFNGIKKIDNTAALLQPYEPMR